MWALCIPGEEGSVVSEVGEPTKVIEIVPAQNPVPVKKPIKKPEKVPA